MIARDEGKNKGKSTKVVALNVSPSTKKSRQAEPAKGRRMERVPRSVNTPANDRRMMPKDLDGGMRVLSKNFVANVEYLVKLLGITWKEVAYMAGLATSTIYSIRNGHTNSGTATAVQFARVLEVEPWCLFVPHEKFREIARMAATSSKLRKLLASE